MGSLIESDINKIALVYGSPKFCIISDVNVYVFAKRSRFLRNASNKRVSTALYTMYIAIVIM